jgi:predicted PurR-regulated permease PerM
VATGTVLVAILQGLLAGIGFAIFGIPRPILWGTIGALGALLPGLGTITIMVPGVLYLLYLGNITAAVGLMIWAAVCIVVVDNFISPYLMSRGNNLHPFVVLLSVLGGIALFGPIGFIIGPVMISLFLVLLELYGQYMSDDGISTKRKK